MSDLENKGGCIIVRKGFVSNVFSSMQNRNVGDEISGKMQ